MLIRLNWKIFAVIAVALLVLFVSGSMTGWFVSTGKYDNFARCLTESGVVMYGTYWCGHCKNQKAMFGGSFKYIKYVECDPRGDGANPQLCKEKGIQGYPTWIIDGNQYAGEQPLEILSSLTGCPL